MRRRRGRYGIYGTGYMGRAVRIKAPSPRGAVRTLLLAGLGLALGGAIYGGTALAEWAVASETFLLKELHVNGNVDLPDHEIMQAAGVSRGVSIFSLPIEKIRRAVCSLPTVKCCSVRRRLPDRLIISVAERRPYFLFNCRGVWRVDREGVVLGTAQAGDLECLPMAGLREAGQVSPGSLKPGASLDAGTAGLMVETIRAVRRHAPELCEVISEICVTQGGGIVLFTRDPPHRVLLGKGGPKAESLVALSAVLGDLRRRDLKGMEIDLRFSRQLVVRTCAPQKAIRNNL